MTMLEVAARLGNLDPHTYQHIAIGRTKTIRRRTEQAIARLYDELRGQRGPSARSRQIALRKGWLPPLAWDDDTIGDPAAEPHVDGVPKLRERGRRVEELVEDFHDTWDYHLGDLEVAAARLGATRNILDKNLSRARAKGIAVSEGDGHMSITDERAREIARIIAWVDGDTFEDLVDVDQITYMDFAQQCAEDLGLA